MLLRRSLKAHNHPKRQGGNPRRPSCGPCKSFTLEDLAGNLATLLEQRGAHRHWPERGNARMRNAGGFDERFFGQGAILISATCLDGVLLTAAESPEVGPLLADHGAADRLHLRFEGWSAVFRDIGHHGRLAWRQFSRNLFNESGVSSLADEIGRFADNCAARSRDGRRKRTAEHPRQRADQSADSRTPVAF